jgi:hypothetical protein
VKHIYHNAGGSENPTFSRTFYDELNAYYKQKGKTEDLYIVGESLHPASGRGGCQRAQEMSPGAVLLNKRGCHGERPLNVRTLKYIGGHYDGKEFTVVAIDFISRR